MSYGTFCERDISLSRHRGCRRSSLKSFRKPRQGGLKSNTGAPDWTESSAFLLEHHSESSERVGGAKRYYL